MIGGKCEINAICGFDVQRLCKCNFNASNSSNAQDVHIAQEIQIHTMFKCTRSVERRN